MSSCAICLEPELNTPAACVPCGHTFCLACITQWTRSPPRFGLSLCPQCRAPVREVQKLFISDWPAAGGPAGGSPLPSQQSQWQQFLQLLTLLGHFLSIPFHAVAQYGPEMGRRVTVWLNQQAERLVLLRARLVQCLVICHREWRDLGRPAQCTVGAALLLVTLLLVQDLQDPEGIHRGIVLPIFLVLLDIIKQLLFAGAYTLSRPLSCCLACVGEVAAAVVDVGAVLVVALACVAFDVLCVPWMVVCVAARLLCAVLSVLAGFVRVCVFCAVLALSLGVPTFLAAPGNQAMRAQLPELLQAGMEWLRRTLLHHTQALDTPAEAQAQPAARPHRHFLREFLRLLSEELRNSERERGEDGEVEEEEEREVGEGVEVGELQDDFLQLAAPLNVGETLEVR